MQIPTASCEKEGFAAFAKRLRPGCSLLAAGARSQRLLFLDVDGVLNTIASIVNPKSIVTPGWPGPLSNPLLVRLVKLLQATGALIVLSSTWRLQEAGIVALMRGLDMVGIDSRKVIVGSTPSFPGGRRAHEIADWLQSHGPCASWAAVDDLDLWSEDPKRMNRHAVKTLLSSGLQQSHAQELARILRDDANASRPQPATVSEERAALDGHRVAAVRAQPKELPDEVRLIVAAGGSLEDFIGLAPNDTLSELTRLGFSNAELRMKLLAALGRWAPPGIVSLSSGSHSSSSSSGGGDTSNGARLNMPAVLGIGPSDHALGTGISKASHDGARRAGCHQQKSFYDVHHG